MKTRTRKKPNSVMLDSHMQDRLATFALARLSLFTLVLFTTIFLRQEVLGEIVIRQIYLVLLATFTLALLNISFWSQTLRVRLFLPSQLLYDILLTSYLVYLTGVNESIFLFLYLLNIAFASAAYQLKGALVVAALSGTIYACIYYVNVGVENSTYYNLAYIELLFLLSAILCSQLMDEMKRQKALLDSQRVRIARLELLNDRLLNSIPVGIVTVDQDEIVQNINVTALTLLGLDSAPETRMKYYELLPSIKGIISAWPLMSDVQKLRFTFHHGSDSPELSFNLVPLRYGPGETNSSPGSHILIFENVSKLRELERKLDFETRLAATGELAAGIAHEIRNPLASISGSIEMLSHSLELSTDSDRKLFEIALREVTRLNLLITDFLEFAKPRDESAGDFDINEAIREVKDAIGATPVGIAHVQFEINITPGLCVHANRERIKQVFFNLFLNSIEAAGKQNVRITVTSSADRAGHTRIDVIDNGPGIAEDIQKRVFEPFFTTKPNGTGLGLPTIARIVKAAKGEVHLQPSQLGAHFQLILPASSTMELAGTAS